MPEGGEGCTRNTNLRVSIDGELRYYDQPKDRLGQFTSTGDSGLTIGQTNDTINGKLKEIIETPKKLGEHTPSEWKQTMIDEGRRVTPLSDGHYKGIPFESGGGYKTNFEDGGLFMYHPAEFSHHKGEYYKISVGKKGMRRYDRNGKRIT